jgi:hypothetical protein
MNLAREHIVLKALKQTNFILYSLHLPSKSLPAVVSKQTSMNSMPFGLSTNAFDEEVIKREDMEMVRPFSEWSFHLLFTLWNKLSSILDMSVLWLQVASSEQCFTEDYAIATSNFAQSTTDVVGSNNIGYKMLQKFGWKGQGLGKSEQGEAIK